MPGPRPDDVYNPVPSAPTLGMPSDYATQQATPEAFGSQIGQSLEKVGSQFTDSANKQMDYQLEVQGLANEHSANVGDTAFAVQGGQIYDEYKRLEGLEAANSKDKYIQKYLDVYQNIRKGLGNPLAQKAFDAIATRRMSFTVQDMNSYAAQQTKSAYREGNSSSQNLSIDNASKFSVASDENQFGFEMGNVIHQTNAMFTAPKYGKYQNTPAQQGPDGHLKFDTSTNEGKVAQADYDNYLNQVQGKIWTNRIMALADDPVHGNVLTAVDTLEKNKDSISAATFRELSQKLHGPYQAEQARSNVDRLLSGAQHQFQNAPDGGSVWVRDAQDKTGKHVSSYVSDIQDRLKSISNPTVDDVVHAMFGQESSFGKNTKPNGVSIGPMQITPDTFQRYAHPGEDINNTNDNMVVGKRIVADLYKKYDGDPSKIATAYFSGEGNVSDRKAAPESTNFINWMGLHQPELIEQARDQAKSLGLDVTGQDQFASRMEARIAELRSGQAAQEKAYRDNIISMVNDPKNPIVNEAALDYSNNPQIRDQWTQFQALNPYGAQAIRSRIKANAQGQSGTLGTDFYTHYMSVLKGTDPNDLQDYFGGNKSPISSSGIPVLDRAHELLQTPKGQAQAQATANFLEKMHNEATGQGLFPGLKDSRLEEAFGKSLGVVLPQIEAGFKAGKSARDLFDEKSPDYVGKAITLPKQSEVIDAQKAAALAAIGNKHQELEFNTFGDFQKAITDKKISGPQALEWAKAHGQYGPGKWITPSAPSVPRPQ